MRRIGRWRVCPLPRHLQVDSNTDPQDVAQQVEPMPLEVVMVSPELVNEDVGDEEDAGEVDESQHTITP
jgi:hypothetical protein